jgi:glycosyltransferase 2 family protein
MTDQQPPPQRSPISPNIIRATAVFVGSGVIFYSGSLLFVDRQVTFDALLTLGIPTLIIGALLSSSSYLWRFFRWQKVLNMLKYDIPLGHNLLIYLSGLALTATPGKVGETFRSALLLPHGVRVPHSFAAFLTDRATDVLGMLLLGVIAATVLSQQTYLWVLALIGLLGVSILLAKIIVCPKADLIWTWLRNQTFRWIPTASGRVMIESWAGLWVFPSVVGFTILALIAYGTQALVFAWFCLSVSVELPLAQLVLIFVKATLFGAASMLPGGLGAMEASLVYQLMDLGVDSSIAISLAIAIRLVTLWFGMLLGGLAMLSVTNRLRLTV